MDRPARIVDAFSGKMTKHFYALVYYHVNGLILAGVPSTDISIVEAIKPNIETIINIKGSPKIRLVIRVELKENRIYFDEYYYNACQPTHLKAFMDARKSQPTAT